MSQTSEIIEIVTNMPGATLAEIRQLMSEEYKNPGATVSLMAARGELRKELNSQKRYTYFIGDGKPPIPKKALAKVPIPVMPDLIPTKAQELQELKEWKAWAISLYPELAVPPALKRAREYAIEFYKKTNDTQKIRDINEGKLDHTPLIQVALLAIEA